MKWRGRRQSTRVEEGNTYKNPALGAQIAKTSNNPIMTSKAQLTKDRRVTKATKENNEATNIYRITNPLAIGTRMMTKPEFGGDVSKFEKNKKKPKYENVNARSISMGPQTPKPLKGTSTSGAKKKKTVTKPKATKKKKK